MVTTDKSLAEATLHLILAASYASHQPQTNGMVVATLAYLGLAALYLVKEEQHIDEEQQE